MSDFVKYANSFQTVISLGLGRITALLAEMGNPHKGLRFIHVAGTNGKGSVCANLEKILMAAGFKTGRYTSPNLIRVNERITVDGAEIPDSRLNPLLEETGGLCERVKEKTGEYPTQFEVWTAAAMKYFKEENCGYVILEVGLGGEFDATNVIETNEAAVIARIALDHCAFLGNSLREIAKTKCGIIKPGKITVALNQEPEVNSVVEGCASEKANRLIFSDIPKSTGFCNMKERFDYRGMKNLSCGLAGPHQMENAALAIDTALALGIGEVPIREGLAAAVNPARLETLKPGLIFDGAHNPNGAEALVKALDRYFPQGGQTVIFACMKDKDIVPSLKLLDSKGRSFIFTQVNNPRSMKAGELKALAAENGIEGESAVNLKDAVSLAFALGKPTVICGSLYLYEDVPEAAEEWG